MKRDFASLTPQEALHVAIFIEERNAEIYDRYLAGEDSTVLARVYNLSDRRIRNIIERELKRRGH